MGGRNNMNQKTLEKEITQFRDDLKAYQEIVQDIWRIPRYSRSEEFEKIRETKEAPLREKLTEDFGKLERYLRKIGISMMASQYGISFPIFDSALEEKLFDNPTKGGSLQMALQMTIKALGIIKSMDDKEFRKLEKGIPTVFIPYNLGEKNKEIVTKFIDFISKFDVVISVGSETDTTSVSEKVKLKIDNADIIIAIITKDEQDDKGNWSSSKWIIEELAYSLGCKNKEIIRLIEKDCITDGRIFGDKEYILFNRENPTEAFIKLAEVLNKKIAK